MSLSLLIVDDDKFTRMKVQSVLQKQGFRVQATDDWAEITRIIAQDSIDVILMDVEMPHLNGDRIASVILKTVENPPRIFLHSTLAPEVLDAKAKEIGIHGFIPKGVSGEEYAEKIEAALTKASSFDGAHLGISSGDEG